MKGEFHENAIRKDFLPSEIDAIRRAMEPVEKAAAKGRQGTRTDLVETFHEVPKPQKTRDKIGAFAGVSGRTVEKIAEVVAAAEENPEELGGLVEVGKPPEGVENGESCPNKPAADQGEHEGAGVGTALDRVL